LLELLNTGIDVNFQNEKSDLRKRYRRERSEHSVNTPYSHLIDSKEISLARVIASYISYGDEPNTAELNQAIIAAGKKLLLPRMIEVNGEVGLEWVAWNGDPQNLKAQGRILEPIGPAATDHNQIDLVIVPALRVDRDGYRLGQGGGFYDRALAQVSAWTIALVFPEEISGQSLPRESHDIPVKAYATYDMVVRLT
jgi:5-formyltetrahydrofolate cyclo-ligase